VLVLVTARLAHVSRGALPSVPRWMWGLVFLGCLTATFAGGSPEFTVGTVTVGLGGALNFLRITVLSIVLLGLGALVSWTTNVAEIAPAVAKLGRPLRRLRLPVDDWQSRWRWRCARSHADRRVPHPVRRAQAAPARRRHPTRPQAPVVDRDRRPAGSRDHRGIAPRRRDGDAITARGGAGQISAQPSRPKWRDAVAFAIVLALCGLSIYIEVFTPLATS